MSINTQSLQPLINFIYSVADQILINTYEPSKYKDVILPMTVIRRLDAVLEPTKDKVLETHEKYKDKLNDMTALLSSKQNGSGQAFYNTSPYTLKKLLEDPKNLRSNFENYLNGFSNNVQDIISKFKFRNEIETLDEAGKLFSTIEKFVSPKIDLRPESLPPLAMGYVFEDLLRRFNEATNAEAGRHFTPREIIELMTHVLFLPVKEQIQNGTFLIYDPCAGSGAMLTESKKYITDEDGEIKSKATVHVYGQENTPTIYAISKSDMLLKGEDPEKIVYGSTLSQYGFPKDLRFDFMLTNPPYGTSWADDKKALSIGDKGKIIDSRFQIKQRYAQFAEPAITRVNDGQLMFVLHMLSKMKETEQGSRIATVHNGSALFTGDAGQGESEIRKHIIESDMLEAIIALPNDIFYNTGIPTYIFIITNRKPKHRQGQVQLINANGENFFGKMKKSLGSKRNELVPKNINDITKLYLEFKETEHSKLFDNNEFGYSQIIVHRPLRLMVQFTAKRIAALRFVSNNAALREELFKEFGNEVYDKKATAKLEQWLLNYFMQDSDEEETEEEASELTIASLPKKKQKIVKQLLDTAVWQRDLGLMNHAKTLAETIGDKLFDDFNVFEELLDKALKKQSIKLAAKDKKDLLSAVGWTDPKAAAVIKKKHKDGSIEYVSDPALKDYENIPLKENIQSFFEREVIPFADDAWWNEDETKVGYEINFNKYFYQYTPPRSKEAIAADLFAIEHETENLLKEIVA
ncbi:MAG: type I restriction-modification system subunit M [Bacteroidetes bacterium]|uniref:type I restriction-modification system subunit M n=1 Tax=Phnomibacter sp. TaxID=2836217 RepID=UPI002FDC7ABA|nr:type I restriction-modification system subunit M [Bacteroidota bacterium]